jgi:hypothetical protein
MITAEGKTSRMDVIEKSAQQNALRRNMAV